MTGTWYEAQNDQNNKETMKKLHLGERSIIIGNYYVTSCLLSHMKKEFFKSACGSNKILRQETILITKKRRGKQFFFVADEF